MKRLILSLVYVFWAWQGFAQFQGTQADFDKIKASFPKLEANTYIPTLKGADNPDLSDYIVQVMNMAGVRLSTAKNAKHVYKAIGYYDHNENFATFFYLSLIPEQPDFSPVASIHLQVIDKKAFKAVKHMGFGNTLSPHWRKHSACAYITEAFGFRVSEQPH